MAPRQFFECPPLWQDQTVFVIGSGPGLKGMALDGLARRHTIAINNAFQIVPDPSVIYYADTRWWRWHGPDIPLEFPGRIYTTSKCGDAYLDPRVRRFRQDHRFATGGPALSHDRNALAGFDSGYQAINLAYHLGCSRVVLLGFDMGFVDGKAHFHPDHAVPSEEENYIGKFGPHYPRLFDELGKLGVEVIRSSPSRLDIPFMTLDDALALPDRQRW